MFGLTKEKIFTKSITRKYKNARITMLDAKFKIEDDREVMLDVDNVDRLLSEINKAVESNSSKYNPTGKRILIANDEELINNFNKSSKEEELKETPLKEEFVDVYLPKYNLDDVYLCEKEKKQIMNVLNIQKHAEKLYGEWGFGEKNNVPKSIVFNFFGPPGTGKSMAAEAVAKYLDKKIYSINYANLESKYVGQTPKNIKKAFDMAKADNAVLVFEEADSFLGKRLTNISQSADYGVNITRSVMLVELEKFEGVVIFTTNLLANYDEAFKRRILSNIEFKMPDKEGRREVFKLHTPENMPLSEDVTFDKLADKFEGVSGADIKDIVFMAAVNALEYEKENVSMDDFKAAYNNIKNRYTSNEN